MKLSHRFKVASKKKGGMAACRRRSRWIKKYWGYIESTIGETNRREITEPIAEPLPTVGRKCQERGKSAYSDAIKSMIDLEYKSCLAGIIPLLASKYGVLNDTAAIHKLISTEIYRTRAVTALKIPTTVDVIINIPAPPAAPLPPKNERYISMGCVKDVLNVSEPVKKTVTQKMAGLITSLTNRVRGVFNA
jgi:hypothetical protein